MKKLRLFGILLIAVTLISILIFVSFFNNPVSGIGIIGGADSPTALFMITQNKPVLYTVLFCIFVGLFCIIYSFRKKK